MEADEGGDRIASAQAEPALANVVSFSGRDIGGSGKAVPEVVGMLEHMLERARRGEIRGFACVYVRGNGMPSSLCSEFTAADEKLIYVLHSGLYLAIDRLTRGLNSAYRETVDHGDDSA